jgi:hypothetical protein
LILLLVATLAASAWLALKGDDEPAVAPLTPARLGGPTSGRAPITGDGPAASAEPAPQAAVELRRAWPPLRPTAQRAWGPPPAAPPEAARAPAPVAASATPAVDPVPTPTPAFPYQWIGRYDDGDTVLAMLSGPSRSVGMAAGQVLDGEWRIDRIEATRLVLTWLPGDKPVSVPAR